MHHLAKTIVVFIIFFALAQSARANGLDEYFEAARELQDRVEKGSARREMPTLADPKVAYLLSVVTDYDRFVGTPSYEAKDLETLMEVCNKANRLSVAYVLAGAKEALSGQSNQKTIAESLRLLGAKNAVTYQNELASLQPFLVRCMARTIPLLTAFARSLKAEELTEVRLEGLQRLKAGIFGIYYGVLLSSNCKELREANRLTLLSALAETAEQYSSAIHPTARRQLVVLATQAKEAATDGIRSQIDKLVEAMNSETCEGICNL